MNWFDVCISRTWSLPNSIVFGLILASRSILFKFLLLVGVPSDDNLAIEYLPNPSSFVGISSKWGRTWLTFLGWIKGNLTTLGERLTDDKWCDVSTLSRLGVLLELWFYKTSLFKPESFMGKGAFVILLRPNISVLLLLFYNIPLILSVRKLFN